MPVTDEDLKIARLFSIAGKTAVLTGASGFLGRFFARTLLANGARVVALGRSARLRQEAQAWAHIYGSEKIHYFQVDMYDLTALGEVFGQITETEPAIDILINNAHELGAATGFNVPEGQLELASWDAWMRNLMGGVYWPAVATQKIGERMKQQNSGSIINISTMYALVAPRPQIYAGTAFINPPGYSASKAALLSFTRYVASFWGRYGIRANAILPGPFSNLEDACGQNTVAAADPFLQRLSDATCLGRIGKPGELSGALIFLASDASSYMTGQAVVMDGGWTAV